MLQRLTCHAKRPPVLTDDQHRADLHLLQDMNVCCSPMVVETSTLPRLLRVDNTVLIVRLTASTPVRSQRLRTRSPGQTSTAATRLVELTDALARERTRAAWDIDVAEPRAIRWTPDLVIGCPDPDGCSDKTACIEIVTALQSAAYHGGRSRVPPAAQRPGITPAGALYDAMRNLTRHRHLVRRQNRRRYHGRLSASTH